MKSIFFIDFVIKKIESKKKKEFSDSENIYLKSHEAGVGRMEPRIGLVNVINM